MQLYFAKLELFSARDILTDTASLNVKSASPTAQTRARRYHTVLDKVKWEPSASYPDDDTELVVFAYGSTIPSTKVPLFHHKEAFDIVSAYMEPESLPGTINPWLAKFTAKSVLPDASGGVTCMKLKTRLNLHSGCVCSLHCHC
jgi:heat shock 70kDa protein 4